MCVLYVVSRLNYEPAGVRESGPSPREAFIGRKPDGKRDFRCSLGDYAQCIVPNTDSTLKARTEDCVVMFPLGNRTGSVRMLSLGAGRLVNRDQFRILPMLESVIRRLNGLALADGRVKGQGELATRPTAYEQESGAKAGLPDTIETMVNNGVDPSIAALRDTDYLEHVEETMDEQQQLDNHAGSSGVDLSTPTHSDDAIAPPYIAMRPKPVDMDDLIGILNRLEVGLYAHVDEPRDSNDAQGVPVDYTAGSTLR